MSHSLPIPVVSMTSAQLSALKQLDDNSTYFEYVDKEIERLSMAMCPERPCAVRVDVAYLGRHRAGKHRAPSRPIFTLPSIKFGRLQPATA